MIGIAVLAVAYVISHFYRSFLAVMSPVLSNEMAISPAQLSDALGGWFVAFALSQFLVGVMLDRFGPRRTTAGLWAVFAGGGGLLFAMAQSYWVVFLAMVFLGIGCAPILMASLYIFKRSYHPKKFAMLASAFIGFGLFGNILGSSPLALALDWLGWRGVLVALSLTTILLAILVIVFVEDPQSLRQDNAASGSYRDVLRVSGIWLILPLVFFNYALSGGLRGIWSGPYLDLVHGMDAAGIGTVTLAMALAMAVGSFVYGPLDQIFGSRKWVVAGGGSLALSSLIYWTLFPPEQAWGVAFILVMIGLFAMSYGVLMAHATANIPAHLAGRGLTLVNFFNMGGVGIMQWVTAQVYRQSETAGEPLIGFQAVLWTYIAGYGFAYALYLFSKDAAPNK